MKIKIILKTFIIHSLCLFFISNLSIARQSSDISQKNLRQFIISTLMAYEESLNYAHFKFAAHTILSDHLKNLVAEQEESQKAFNTPITYYGLKNKEIIDWTVSGSNIFIKQRSPENTFTGLSNKDIYISFSRIFIYIPSEKVLTISSRKDSLPITISPVFVSGLYHFKDFLSRKSTTVEKKHINGHEVIVITCFDENRKTGLYILNPKTNYLPEKIESFNKEGKLSLSMTIEWRIEKNKPIHSRTEQIWFKDPNNPNSWSKTIYTTENVTPILDTLKMPSVSDFPKGTRVIDEILGEAFTIE